MYPEPAFLHTSTLQHHMGLVLTTPARQHQWGDAGCCLPRDPARADESSGCPTFRRGSSWEMSCWAETVSMMPSKLFATAYIDTASRHHPSLKSRHEIQYSFAKRLRIKCSPQPQ